MNKFNLKTASWIVALMVCLPLLSFSQSVECTQQLNEANALYDEGRLPEVLDKLQEGDCMQVGFSKEQKTRAYRLMAMVYIFLDDEPNAEDAIIQLLESDPEHPYSVANDPAEFIVLYKKFRYKPIFRVGGFAGVNQSFANSLSPYSSFTSGTDIYDENGGTISKSFEPGIGMHIGALIEYTPVKEINVLKDMELVLRVKFSWQNYVINNPIITNTAGAPGANFEVKDLKEAQFWLSTPLGIRYNIPVGKRKIIPYVIGGASFDYLISANMTGERIGTTTVSVANLDLSEFDMRNKTNWSYFGGAGVKFTVQRTKTFFMEATYHSGGRNFVNGENRYNSQQLNYNIAHIDDDKSLNKINFNIGFIFSIYKPIKYPEQKLLRDASREMKR
ncbi:MAG: hypothetical protein JXR07_19875 [Reichenbachiella sp.]